MPLTFHRQGQRGPPNFFLSCAVMCAISITINKAKSRMKHSLWGLKSRGRGMPINHITVIHNRKKNSLTNIFLQSHNLWQNCLCDIWISLSSRYFYSVTVTWCYVMFTCQANAMKKACKPINMNTQTAEQTFSSYMEGNVFSTFVKE